MKQKRRTGLRILFKKFFCALFLANIFFLIGVSIAAEEEKIKVGWVAHPGLQNYDNGVYSGYTYDYLMAVSEYTGWSYEFVPGLLGDTLGDLKTGDVDIVGGLMYSEERATNYDLSKSEYGKSYISLFTSINSTLKAYDFDNYNNFTVGAIENATVNLEAFAEYALENGFSYNIRYYADASKLSEAVIEQEVDAGFRGAYLVEEDTKILAEFSPTPIYFAVTKGNTDVTVELNRAMNQIQIDNPYLQIELYKKYFAVESVKLTTAEEVIIEASKTNPIKVGVIDNSAPLLYYNSNDEKYEGITVDLMDLVSEKTGLNIEYSNVDLTRAANATTPTDDSPKLVVGVTKMSSLVDSRGWYLSDALISDSLSLVGKRGKDITSKENKTVAIMEGFTMAQTYAQTYLTDYEIIKYKSLNACLKAVADGKADVTLYLNSCVSYLLQKPYFENLEVLPEFGDSAIDMVVAAFVEDNAGLISIINKGINQITEEENRNITLNYTVMNPYKLTSSDIVYKYRVPFIIIGVLVFAVIGSLIVLYIYRRKSSIAIRKAYEQEKEALLVAEKASAAKGSFMSRMSHEIRTPLNAIIGYNTLASNDISKAQTDSDYRRVVMKTADCLAKSNIASKHLLTIINDVLDMSAIESGKIKIAHDRFDFKGLINSITTIFYSQAKNKGVELEVLFSTMTEEWFVGDQMRTNQILTNILSNAVKFTPTGGKVVLKIKQPDPKENAAHIWFEISDTGIGMTEEYVQHIWTPFEQADSSISRRFGGTGLGMSITKNLIDLMGGTIEVKSEVGKGTTFTINLVFERTTQPETINSYDFAGVNALIVDDDQSTCDYITLLMDRFGARSSCALSGLEAVEAVGKALKLNDPYTICLIDWRMPKMDGLETVKRIREIAGKDIPIIVITAYDFSDIVDKAAEYGITRFLAKPLFQSSLFDLLANICGLKSETIKVKETHVTFSKERILLAEDNEMNMEIAVSLLEDSGLLIDTAVNGEEAVKMFEDSTPGTYKAILMDVQMPVMDGYTATKKIRESSHPEGKTIPIIAMTADAFAENVAEALATGMNAHIAKPIDEKELQELLKKLIN